MESLINLYIIWGCPYLVNEPVHRALRLLSFDSAYSRLCIVSMARFCWPRAIWAWESISNCFTVLSFCSFVYMFYPPCITKGQILVCPRWRISYQTPGAGSSQLKQHNFLVRLHQISGVTAEDTSSRQDGRELCSSTWPTAGTILIYGSQPWVEALALIASNVADDADNFALATSSSSSLAKLRFVTFLEWSIQWSVISTQLSLRHMLVLQMYS